MNNTVKHALTAAAILGVFSLIGTGLVSLTQSATKDKIIENEKQALLNSLTALVPDSRYDNDIVNDTLIIKDSLLGNGQPMTVYRARLSGKPVAAVITSIAPDGYNGDIKLLVAVNTDNSLAGVRVVTHKETPGLGDSIDESRSDWIYTFKGKSLNNPELKHWAVKRDGGAFDQFTGATITPRAVVKAVKNTLLYAKAHGAELYTADTQNAGKTGANTK